MSNTSPDLPAPRTHVVTLNYLNDQLSPDPKTVVVGLQESIEFRKGTAPPGNKLFITFDNPEYFSAPSFQEGDPPIVAVAAPPEGKGTYQCGLAPDGSVPAGTPTTPGGSVEVASPHGVSRSAAQAGKRSGTP